MGRRNVMYRENAKTAEPIELPFGMASEVRLVNRVLGGRAHWRHLANTVERLNTAAMSGLSDYFGQYPDGVMHIDFGRLRRLKTII